MLGTGYILKIAKLIPSKKNQTVLIEKISSRKTQKIANSQNNNTTTHFIIIYNLRLHKVHFRKQIAGASRGGRR